MSGTKSLLPSSVLSGVQDMFAARYLTGVGIAVLIYDTLLGFEIELNVIWKTKLNAPKAAYIVYRYGMLASISLFLASKYILPRCSTSFTILTVTIFIIDAIGHGLVIFRTFVLWERKARILRLLFIGSAVINIGSTVFIGLTVSTENSQFSESLHTCINNVHVELLSGFWASQAIFDIYVLGLVLWNAMDRPRTSNQKLLRILYEDGIHLIMITWGMLGSLLVLNFILCLAGGLAISSVTMSFVESVITTINSRLLLHIFRSELQGSQSQETLNYGNRCSYTSRSVSRSSHAALSLCGPGGDETSRSSSGIRLLAYRCTTDMGEGSEPAV
ncbi:hypothetical protein M0805_001233 [Coniferiporia weirii]|nr:hypothetical protein M0805_001233 [Coniferiporia weirii]